MASTSHSVPFTPRPASKASGRFRASGATLSTREENKISHTLASVRKSRPISSLLQAHAEDPSDEDESVLHPPRATSSRQPDERRQTNGGTHRSSRGKEREVTFGGDQSYSMLPEQSFRARPLSSRLPPPKPMFSPSKMSSSEESIRRESQLVGVPLEVQEAMVLRDLLSVLLGIEGELVTFDSSYDPLDETERMKGPAWSIDSGLDPSLSSVLRRILPLATYYMAIEAFIDTRCHLEFGKVNHALGSGLRGMLQEYNVLLTQLETLFLTSPTFTLQKTFFHLHPTIHSLSLLHSLTNQLFHADEDDESESDDDASSVDSDAARLGLGRDRMKELAVTVEGGLVKGGEVLGLIWQMGRNRSGDPTANDIFSTLLLHASQPYAEMLIGWISSGHLTDKYDEFMVKETSSLTKSQLETDYTDEYWEKRYTLRDGTSVSSSSSDAAPITLGAPRPRPGTEADPRLPGGACIPRFLEPWKHKILLAGKYLNVIRECGVDAREGRELEIGGWGSGEMIDLEDEKFHRRIEDAYIHANKTLLKMLIEEEDLLAHLRSIKHHFFLSQSAFITQFLDASASELTKRAKAASGVKLQSLLELALRTSGGPIAENHGDEVRVIMARDRLYDYLERIVTQTGEIDEKGGFGKAKPEEKKELLAFEALQLDYTVKFPVSLVISKKTIARYQVLFRFLFQLKHAELALTHMWSLHSAKDTRTFSAPPPPPSSSRRPATPSQTQTPTQTTPAPWRSSFALRNPEFEAWKRRVFVLRQKMLAFVQQTMAFVTSEVLEPNWRELEEKLGRVRTVDQMLEDHVGFLDTCLKESGLTKAVLIASTSKLLAVIQNFTHQTKTLNEWAQAMAQHIEDPTKGLIANEVEELADKVKRVQAWETNFSHNLKVHIERVTFAGGNENTALTPLVVRLNTFRF